MTKRLDRNQAISDAVDRLTSQRARQIVKVIVLPLPDRLLQPCLRPADRPDAGDDRDLAAWEAETWQHGHDCADQIEGWREW